MRATLPLPQGRKVTDLIPNRAERRHPKRRTPPSRLELAAGFNRSSQRTQREPATPGDVARVEVAKTKRARKGRA